MANLIDLQKPLHVVVDGVLSPAECADWIARIEAEGPALAPITTARGPVIRGAPSGSTSCPRALTIHRLREAARVSASGV